MKRKYIKLYLNRINLDAEQMIASSFQVSDKSVDTQLTNQKEVDMWGKENIWK